VINAVLQILVSPELDMATRTRRLRETIWGRQLILTSKTVLVEFVRSGEQPYASSLSYAPDHLFDLVCFTTLLLIKTKHMHGANPLPTLMPLIERVTEFFRRLALTVDHLPMGCTMIANSGAPSIDKDFVESNVLENNPTRDLENVLLGSRAVEKLKRLILGIFRVV